MTNRLFHGGVPGLRPGDLIEPGHHRPSHDGCPWCAAREDGTATLDPLPAHGDRVYATPHKLYARFYASLYGLGDLYRVAPVGETLPSREDPIETHTAPAYRVTQVVDRAVRLIPAERRRLARQWEAADLETYGLARFLQQSLAERTTP